MDDKAVGEGRNEATRKTGRCGNAWVAIVGVAAMNIVIILSLCSVMRRLGSIERTTEEIRMHQEIDDMVRYGDGQAMEDDMATTTETWKDIKLF